MKKPPSTAQRLGLFREECRKHYASLRKPESKQRPEPNPNIFSGHAADMARKILDEEKTKHETILRGNQ